MTKHMTIAVTGPLWAKAEKTLFEVHSKPKPPCNDLERLMDSTLDATFMKRGFFPARHRAELLMALAAAGYEIVKRD